jgi:hypothetical protein
LDLFKRQELFLDFSCILRESSADSASLVDDVMRIGEKGIIMFFMLFSLSTSYSYLKNESKQKDESNLDPEASCLPALSNTFNLLLATQSARHLVLHFHQLFVDHDH